MTSESKPHIEFRQPRNVSDVINATFAFVRDEFRGFGTALLVIVGPVAVLAVVVGAGAQQALFGALFNPELLQDSFEEMFGAAYVISVLASLVATVLALGVCYSYAMLYAESGPGPYPPGVVWRRFKSDLWVLISTSLWGVLLFVGLFVLNIVPCLGTVAFLVLGVYVAPILMMVYPARMDRRGGFWSTFKRCRELIKGSWWSGFALFLVMYVVVSIIGTAVGGTLVFGYAMIAMLVGGGWLASLLSVPLAIFTLVSYLTYMLMAVAFVILYYGLDEQREGVLLEARIESMLAEPGAADDRSSAFGL